MRINFINAGIDIVTLVFSGGGKARWQNAARAYAMQLESEFASLAERCGIDFSAQAGLSDFLLSFSAKTGADFRQLISSVLDCASPCSDAILKRLEAELLLENSDYNLQSSRGFNQALLGIEQDQNTPTVDEVAQFASRLKDLPLRICASLGRSDLSLKSPKDGWLELSAESGNNNKFLANNLEIQITPDSNLSEFGAHEQLLGYLQSIHKAGHTKLQIRPATSAFDLRQKASCTQSFMHFGAFLGQFDMPSRSSAALASTAFGAGFTSRITELVRVQNGLAYSAYARIAYAGDEAYWLGLMQTKSSNENKAKQLLKEQFALLKNGLSQEEFDAAKSYLIGSSILSMKDFASIHKLALWRLQNDLALDYNDRLLELIKASSLEETNAFLAQFELDISFYIVSQ